MLKLARRTRCKDDNIVCRRILMPKQSTFAANSEAEFNRLHNKYVQIIKCGTPNRFVPFPQHEQWPQTRWTRITRKWKFDSFICFHRSEQNVHRAFSDSGVFATQDLIVDWNGAEFLWFFLLCCVSAEIKNEMQPFVYLWTISHRTLFTFHSLVGNHKSHVKLHCNEICDFSLAHSFFFLSLCESLGMATSAVCDTRYGLPSQLNRSHSK